MTQEEEWKSIREMARAYNDRVCTCGFQEGELLKKEKRDLVG